MLVQWNAENFKFDRRQGWMVNWNEDFIDKYPHDIKSSYTIQKNNIRS